MDSEKIATNHVELAISKADHLVSHINSNDKEPSWDGDVEVYKKSGHVHAKADLILKVPVQVKGHIKPNLKKKSIKYSIQYSDLRNYLYVGGTIFFVVYFDEEDEHHTIYYVGLLPFDLKKMLKDHKGDLSKCKSIELKVFPTKKEDTLQKKLSFLLDVKKTLDAVHVTADLDCSSLSVTDNTNLSILRAALIDKEPIKMCSSQSLLRTCHIANLELLLWVVPTEENSEYYNIYDFHYVPLIYREFNKNDKEYPSTHFVMLNKDAMLKYCNIDYNALLDAVQHVPFSKDYSHSLNALLLEMLKAYDESKNSRIELLSTATTLALWIKDSDPYTEHPIAILNYLQSVKRSRTWTSTEQAEILSLIEAAQDNESIYVGAYLLLDNPVAAKIHFDKLPEESQKFFESCPIYHFMPNGQPTISAPTEG